MDPRARRDQGIRESGIGGCGAPRRLERTSRPHAQTRSAPVTADRAIDTHVPLPAGDPHRRQLRRSGLKTFKCLMQNFVVFYFLLYLLTYLNQKIIHSIST